MILSVGNELRMIDPVMFKLSDIQDMAGAVAVGINKTVRSYFPLDNKVKASQS